MTILGKLVVDFQGSRIGRVVDILFDERGIFRLIVIAKFVVPLIGVGIIRTFIPFTLMSCVGENYIVPVPLNMVRSYRRTYLGDISRAVDAIESRHRWLDLTLTIAIPAIAILITLLSIIYRTIGSITILIAVGLIMVMPVLVRDVLEITVPGLFSIQAVLGSRVYDRWGIAIGSVARVEADYVSGVVKSIVVKKPLGVVPDKVGKLYRDSSTIELDAGFLRYAKRGRVELRVSIDELILTLHS